MNRKIKILSTKSLNDNLLFLLNKENKFEVEHCDFISTKPVVSNQKLKNTHFIFTSKKAVLSAFKQYDFKSIENAQFFTVGLKTSKLIKDQGFKISLTGRYSDDLAAQIIKNSKETDFTFFCGNLHLKELPKLLKQNKRTVDIIEVYETSFTPIAIPETVDAICFFSPSGVKSFLMKNNFPENAVLFAIGKTTAQFLESETKEHQIIVSLQSTIESVLNQVKIHFND